MRSTTTAEVLSLEDGQEEPPVALIEVDGEPAEQSFLWEQIASSLDEVELHEVRRVVGEVLVQSLEDVYSEVRALVALGKTEWTIRIRGDGSEEKTGTANFIVQRGDDAANVRIQSGESGTALGVTVHLHEAGEVYEASSMRWVQFARVTLTVE